MENTFAYHFQKLGAAISNLKKDIAIEFLKLIIKIPIARIQTWALNKHISVVELSGGGEVLLSGTYNLSGPINLKSNVKLRGEKSLVPVEELMLSISKVFNKINFEIYDNEVFINLGILRPANAPHYRKTMADVKRARWSNNMNHYMQSHSFSPYQSIEEALTIAQQAIDLGAYKGKGKKNI